MYISSVYGARSVALYSADNPPRLILVTDVDEDGSLPYFRIEAGETLMFRWKMDREGLLPIHLEHKVPMPEDTASVQMQVVDYGVSGFSWDV